MATVNRGKNFQVDFYSIPTGLKNSIDTVGQVRKSGDILFLKMKRGKKILYRTGHVARGHCIDICAGLTVKEEKIHGG